MFSGIGLRVVLASASRLGWAGHTILINYSNHTVLSRIASVESPFQIKHPMMNLPIRQFLEAVSNVGCDPVTRGICRRPRGDFSGCRREHVIRSLAADRLAEPQKPADRS